MNQKISMIFALFLIFAVIVAPAKARAQEPNPGPRSRVEANQLYEEATTAIAARQYPTAISNLEHFLQRYPTDARANHAKVSLGEAYDASQDYQNSIRVLGDFLKAHPAEPAAQLLLIHGYLKLNRLPEAKVTVDDLLKTSSGKSAPTLAQKQAALLNKADILSRQRKFSDATASLHSYESGIDKVDEVSDYIEMKALVATRECASVLPPHATKNDYEEKAMNYFSNRVLCLKEALPKTPENIDGAVANEWCAANHLLTMNLNFVKIAPEAKEKIRNENLSPLQIYAEGLKKELVTCHVTPPNQK
jgi:tetratricopeptide (TPR) repeat protein